MADSQTAISEEEAQQLGQRKIVPYSWWKKTGENATPFCVVDRDFDNQKGVTLTTHIYICLVGDSNRVKRSVQEFWAAVDAGKIENITYR